MNSSSVGATPTRASGAVSSTIDIAESERTWKMITTIIRMNISGKTAAKREICLAGLFDGAAAVSIL